MLYGVISACVILISVPYIKPLLAFKSPYAKGFLNAAFIEKVAAYISLFYYLKNKKDLEIHFCINSGILFGASFACVENMIYALNADVSVIFIRLFSSVLVHIITCATMGFFIGLYRIYSSASYKIRSLLISFLLPYVLHGLYDSFLLKGGNYTYIIAPLLVILIVWLEYTIARSHIFPRQEYLQDKNITLEDWNILQRQPEYERWITNSMSNTSKIDIPFFRLNTSWKKWVLFVFVLGFCVLSFVYKDYLTYYLKVSLSFQEYTTLFLLYPLVLSVLLFMNGSINSEYFKYSR